MVGVVEPTVSLAPEAGEDFQAVAAAVQANPMAMLLDSGCSHHLMGTKTVFVDMAPCESVKHVRGFNGALQPVEGRGTVALQGEAVKRVLIPDVLYFPGVQANLLSAGQLEESGVQLQGDGDEMLLVAATGEVVALRTIVSATKSTPDRLHARLAHVGVDTIKSSAKHEVVVGLDITPSTGADPPCVSCVGGKLARHTFPDKGSDAEEALAVVHTDLCGAISGGCQGWQLVLPAVEGSPHSVRVGNAGGEFLRKAFTDFVNGKGIVHDLTCSYTLQQNSMAKREMRTVVESVRTMLLHMGVQLHSWHLVLRQAVRVRNCLERSTTPPGTNPYQLLTGKKPNLTLARVWGCMVQFMVPEQQCGGKLAPKARWELHLGVSPESKGWEVLDLTDNKVVTSVEVIFYETLSLEVWKATYGPASGRTQAHSPANTSTAMVPLLTEVDEPADEDIVEVLPPPPVLAPPFPVADRPASTLVSTTSDEGCLEASPVAPASGIAGGRQGTKLVDQDGKPLTTGEQRTGEPVEQEAAAGVHSTGEQQPGQSTGERSKSAGGEQPVEGSKQLVDDNDVKEGEKLVGEESTDSDVVEVLITKPELRRTGQAQRPPERLSFHAYLPPAAFTTVYDEVDDDPLYDDAEEDEELLELDPDVHADPEHRWDIAKMTVKKALASWKAEVVKAAMEEEIRSLIGMGTWELVERSRGVNIMKNQWVLKTKYRIDDTVERKKARVVVKGLMQVCGADYDKMYSPVSSYVTLWIFLSIVDVLNINLMQLDMKNALLQSKLDRVLYMYQPDYFDDGTGRMCKLLKSLYGLKQSPLLWYRELDGVLLGAGWKKSQIDEALHYKAGDNGVTCWVLVYVDDLLAASSNHAMVKELKELLEAAFELREISPVVKYLGLEIVRDRPARKLWLQQQGYANKLRRHFIDEEQGGRVPKMPVSVDAYAELTFDDKEAQERKEEEYRQKVGSLQFAATTTRPDIAFACSKLGSGLTVRSDQHWREVDRCLAYLANTRDTALEFGGGPESLELIGYVDADDASNKQNRMSTGGYVFVYGGAAVSWSSSRIKCATLSSTESEYVAATDAGKEGRQPSSASTTSQQLRSLRAWG
ncbi:unnamed protein product [Closterium sp. NIES-53]